MYPWDGRLVTDNSKSLSFAQSPKENSPTSELLRFLVAQSEIEPGPKAGAIRSNTPD